jgi:hypothetical protein
MGTRVQVRQVHRIWAKQSQSSLGTLALTFVYLFAFLVQSFVTQTHVHFSEQSAAVSSAIGTVAKGKSSASQQRDHRDLPSKDDPANCPFCQQIAVAGAFFSPAIAVLQLPTEAGLFPQTLALVAAATLQVSHNWQGRAPPIV